MLQVIRNHGTENACFVSREEGSQLHVPWQCRDMIQHVHIYLGFNKIHAASQGLTDSHVWTLGFPFDYLKPRYVAPVAMELGTPDFLVPECPLD